MKDSAFENIRDLPILETHSAHFLKVLELGCVSTNVYLRRIHNFALEMNWLSWSILPKRQWPKVKFKAKRAITLEEHQRIIAAEVNPEPERKTLYQLCWHLGANQGDIADLKGEDVDWTNSTVSFTRQKSGVPVLVLLGAESDKWLSRWRDQAGKVGSALSSLVFSAPRFFLSPSRCRRGHQPACSWCPLKTAPTGEGSMARHRPRHRPVSGGCGGLHRSRGRQPRFPLSGTRQRTIGRPAPDRRRATHQDPGRRLE
jgi:integrase